MILNQIFNLIQQNSNQRGNERFIFMSLTLRSLCFFLFEPHRFKPSECLRAIEHHKNFILAFSLITAFAFFKTHHCNFQRVPTSEVLMLLLFKKHEHSECIINLFALGFAFETTRAKRVPQPLILPLILFYSFKKLLNTFRHPSRPHIARLSDFKKLQMA